MKTPREILLETYRPAEPHLDRLSSEVVSSEVGTDLRAVRGRLGEASLPLAPRPHQPWPTRFFAQAWQELFWSCRRTWAGLAIVWVVLAIIHFADTKSVRPSPPTFAVSSQDVIFAWKEQERLLAELAEATRPTPTKIKPSSLPVLVPSKTSGLARLENESLA